MRAAGVTGYTDKSSWGRISAINRARLEGVRQAQNGEAQTQLNAQQAATPRDAVPAAPKRTRAQASADRKRAYRETNPFRSFLAEYGINVADRADVGWERNRPVMVPYHGPLFRKNGMRLDELALLAVDAGFLTQADIDSDLDNGGVNKLSDMIQRELAGERILTIAQQESAEEERWSAELDARYEAMQEAEDAIVEQASDDEINELLQLASDEDAELRNEEIDFAADEKRLGGEAQEGTAGTEASGDPASGAAARDEGSGEVGDFLTPPTPDGLRAQADAIERARAEQARRDAAPPPEDFVLTGSTRPADEAAARGQMELEQSARPQSSPSGVKQRDITDSLIDAPRAADVEAGRERAGKKAPEDPADFIPSPAPTKAAAAASRKPAIADFGEKIEGARKDVWASFRDKMQQAGSVDIAAEPLSKSWPAPDYQALLDDGADPWAVAFMHAARDSIPTKPQKSWKVKEWAENVRLLRDASMGLADGSIDRTHAQRMLAKVTLAGHGLGEAAGRIELYQLVGHSKSLAGVRVWRGEYSLRNGITYKPPKIVWTVEKKAAATAFSNWPMELASGDTKEQALADFKERFDSLEINPPAKKETTFEVYSRRGEKGFWVGKKVGRNPIFLAGPFETVKEARAHKDAHNAELTEKLAKSKEVPSERRDTNRPRVGEDMRGGADVTPQMFEDAFGFKGVQFGNCVEQGRRQKDLNDAYDALMDMAAVLGVPPKALSLNGELGLAFGARGKGGKGAAMAHYESGRVVINLTKREGAGSLGHEWWHALDNYFSRMRAAPSEYMTDGSDVSAAAHGAGFTPKSGMVRREMIQAFGEVMKAIRSTAVKVRSGKLDAKRAKAYWSTSTEMSARAFESYLISKLQDQGASNDYLANIVDEATWAAGEKLGFDLDGSYPYPTAGEAPAIRAAFDHFFDTIQSRQDGSGKVALFSRKDDAPSNAQPKVERERISDPDHQDAQAVARLARALEHAHGKPVAITAVRLLSDRGEQGKVARIMHGWFGRKVVWFESADVLAPEGVYLSGNTLFVNVDADAPARRVAGHELLHSIKRSSPALYAQVLRQLRAIGIREFPAYKAALVRQYAKDGLQTPSMDLVREEMTADIFGHFFLDPSLLRELGARMERNPFKRLIQRVWNFLKNLRSKSEADPFLKKHVADIDAARQVVLDALELTGKADGYSLADVTREALRLQTAWHGTPHRGIEETGFKLNRIGTGEGAQAYGWGVYFASLKEVAQKYQPRNPEAEKLMLKEYSAAERNADWEALELWEAALTHKLSSEIRNDEAFEHIPQAKRDAVAHKMLDIGRKTAGGGNLYTANIPDADVLLDWDKPLSEQPPKVLEALIRAAVMDESVLGEYTGQQFYENLIRDRSMFEGMPRSNAARAASEYLQSIGIPGLRYLDGDSRGKGEGSYNYVIWDEALLTPEAAEIQPMFSRRAGTQAAYEARIDALFAGERPSLQGARVLDRSDVLDMLGLGEGPVNLAESKVLAGRQNHPLMTSEVWKKIPHWLDNPAMVFDSDTVPGRIVFIAPELIRGNTVRIVVDPNPRGGTSARLLLNAYDAERSPFRRWESDGLLRYVDRQKSAPVSGTFQPRLDGLPGRGRAKILTEKNLAGYRRNASPASARGGAAPGLPPEHVTRVADAVRAKWDNGPEVIVVESIDDPAVPAEVREAAESKRTDTGDFEAEGFFHDGTVYLVADQLDTEADVVRVLLHEAAGHYGLRGLFGDRLNAILDQIIRAKPSEVARKMREYRLRGPEGRRLAAEEVLASMAQTNPQAGFVRRAIAAVRAWLREIGFDLKMSDSEIIVHVLVPARQWVESGAAMGKRAKSPTFSARTGGERDAFVSEALAELAANDELFRYPVSRKATLDGVMADVFPEAQYLGEDTRPDERVESGADTRHVFRTAQGKMAYIFERGNEVWLDISRFQEGDRGDGVYAAAMNYAHNAGKRFIGDPAGLSEAAVIRRTSAMLSSALRFGTTKHMDAAPEQVAGIPEKGIAPLKWQGDDLAKTTALIDSFLSTLYTQFPALKGYRYDFRKGQFLDRSGRPVGLDRFADARRLGVARAAKAGSATARRGIFLQSLVSSEGSKRPELLEHILRRGRALTAEGGPARAMFSRRQASKKVSDAIADLFQSSKGFNWWHRTIGTQYEKAQRNAHFRRVFEASQEFLNDIQEAPVQARSQCNHRDDGQDRSHRTVEARRARSAHALRAVPGVRNPTDQRGRARASILLHVRHAANPFQDG